MENEELNKKKKTTFILPAIVLLVAIFTLGYYTYNEFYAKEEDTDKNEAKEPYSQADEEVFYRIKKVVEDELFVLNGLSDIDELTPEIKAYLALNLYSKDKTISEEEKINASLLENAYKSSSLSKHAFTNTNIPCTLATKFDHYAWTYKAEDKTYEYTEIGHGGIGVEAIDSEVVEKKVKDGLYTISYIYLWESYGDFDYTYEVFPTYEDALAMKNPLVKIDENFDKKRTIDTYAYEPKVLEKIDTYTYTFELINNELKLKDFTRS